MSGSFFALHCNYSICFPCHVIKGGLQAAPATSLSEFSEVTVGVLAECCMHRFQLQAGVILGGCDALKGPHDRQLAFWQRVVVMLMPFHCWVCLQQCPVPAHA